ncbi:MAG: Sigma(54) modulation protein [Rickettsiaceae bacterium]|jgi:ribosomal subunit interface protein|nr:Sigma(54) modulation protein [Rickettsiaceae bacterium]
MQIFVSGKHLDVGSALHNYVESELTNTVSKYFEHAVSANVVFTKVRHLFKADIIVNEGTGHQLIIKGGAEDDDAYAAFDLALTRIAKQLRKYKGRIKDHHKSRPDKDMQSFGATKYVISNEESYQSAEDAPVIIAEKPTEVETLTVSDAVMRMDLGQLPALMFINKKTMAVNVIYRREDGNISWISSGDATAIAA